MQKTRVITPDQQSRHRAADHSHQRVDRDQAADPLQGLGTHDVEAEPADNQDPRTQRQKGNVRRGERHQLAIAVTPVARAEQQHCRQGQPTAHGMHHHRAGKVMEAGAEPGLQPGLQAQIAIPDDAFEEGIDQCDDQRRSAHLRSKARPLGDTAGNDCRDRRGKGQQEKELHQAVTMLMTEHRRRLQEIHAIGNPVANEEVRQG
ncbi:hypothetical protein D3C80_943060 [compost metagenome]